jgi:putative CocE/NonD family hydrolase
MRRTPYDCTPYGTDKTANDGQTIHSPFLVNAFHLAQEGYIFVLQDVRGRFMSEGVYSHVRPHGGAISESTDTYDTIDWLMTNAANNNGLVGMFGISYPGFYCTAALPGAHPALKAVSPQAPVTNWFMGDDFHHNGAFMMMDAFQFFYGFREARSEPHGALKNTGFVFPTPDNYDFYLRSGAISTFKKQYYTFEVPFWDSLMAHPNYDNFWQSRDIRPHLDDIRPAVLTVGGTFDAENCYGAFATYKALEAKNPQASNKLVMGPWWHGAWLRDSGQYLGNISFGAPTSLYYRDSIEAPFFRHHLKGASAPPLPEARIFITGQNRWHDFDQWPPLPNRRMAFYIASNKQLGAQPGTNGSYTYTSDPQHPVPYAEDVHLYRTRSYMTDDQRFASRRPDVLTLQTAPTDTAMTFAGPAKADIWIRTDATDLDLVVKIIDVFPDSTAGQSPAGVPYGGYQMPVRMEVMRVKYRNNNWLTPQPIEPGRPTRVQFDLPDIAHTFMPGHRLMIQIQSSWFPLVDRNPQQFLDIYTCQNEDFRPAQVEILYGTDSPSHILLLQHQ